MSQGQNAEFTSARRSKYKFRGQRASPRKKEQV
jgi:hypothetical protein